MERDEFFAELREMIEGVGVVATGREARVVIYALSFLIGKTIADGPLSKAERDRGVRMACEVIDDVVNGRHRRKTH